MWLHKFIPQPCFDNASAEGGTAGGPGGVNRTSTGARSGGIMSNSGGGYQETAQGIPGYGTAQEGRAFNAAQDARNAASRGGGSSGGGGGGSRSTTAPTLTVTVPGYLAKPPVATPTISAPSLAQLTALTPKSYTAPVTAQNAAVYGPAAMGMMSSPVTASTAALAASIANAPVASRAKESVAASPADAPGNFGSAASTIGSGSLADRASAPVGGGVSGVNSIGGMNGGSMASLGLDRGGNDRGTPGGISGGAMASRGMDGPNFGGGPQSNVAAKSDRGVPSLNTPGDTINGVNVAGKSDFGVPTSGPNRGALSDFAGITGINRTAKADFSPVGLLSSPLSNLSNAEISSLIGSIVSDPRAGTTGLSPQGAFATNNPSDLSLTKSALSQGLPTRETMAGLLNTPNPTKAIQDRLQTSTASMAPSLNSRAVNEMVKQAVPSMRDQNFYSSDNAYEGVNFPNVPNSYPSLFGDQTGTMGVGNAIRGPNGYANVDMMAGVFSPQAPASQAPASEGLPGGYSETTDTSGYTEATDIAQDVMDGNYSDAISKTIDRFGAGTAMQIAGLLSGWGGGSLQSARAQDREAGISRGEGSDIANTVIGLLTGNIGGGANDGTDQNTTPPINQPPWTPPGLLNRPYSNPFAYRNPWLTA